MGLTKEEFEKAENTILTFGKYKGETVGDINRVDENYLIWLHETLESGNPLIEIIDTVCFTWRGK